MRPEEAQPEFSARSFFELGEVLSSLAKRTSYKQIAFNLYATKA